MSLSRHAAPNTRANAERYRMDIPLLGYFAEHGFNVISVDYR